jgi:RNA polymerase sigma-70 factor (ECF subfamily)
MSPNVPETLAGYRGGVCRFLLFLTQSKEIADEMTQETFRVALAKGTDPGKGANYGAWLRSIAKNLVRNYQRKQHAQWLFFSSELVDLAEQGFLQAGGVRDDYWEALRSALLSCIQKLSDASRSLLLRRYKLRQTVKEIALGLGIEPNSLSKRLERIRQSLRDCIRSVLKGE